MFYVSYVSYSTMNIPLDGFRRTDSMHSMKSVRFGNIPPDWDESTVRNTFSLPSRIPPGS